MVKQIVVSFTLNIKEGLTPDKIDEAIDDCPLILKGNTFIVSTESWGYVIGED